MILFKVLERGRKHFKDILLFCFFFKHLFLIKGKLLYTIVLASAIQHHESAVECSCVPSLFNLPPSSHPFPPRKIHFHVPAPKTYQEEHQGRARQSVSRLRDIVLYLLLFFNLLFNWKKIVLWWCVGFCCTTTWISHNYTYIPLPLEPPFPSLMPPF